MKKSIRVCAILLILALAFSSVSCIKSDVAKATVDDLFACLSEGRFEDATALFHPISNVADVSALQTFDADLKSACGASFTDGIRVEKYVGFRSAAYDSTVDGALYELSMIALIGEVSLNVVVSVVENDDGYGIAEFRAGLRD